MRAKWVPLTCFTCLGAAFVLLLIWATSLFTRIGLIALTRDTTLRGENGVIEIRHIYAHNLIGVRWSSTTAPIGRPPPPRPHGFPTFGFSSGHVIFRSGNDLGNNYWLLRIPLWALIIPPAAIGSWLAMKWHHQRQSHRRGFPIEPVG